MMIFSWIVKEYILKYGNIIINIDVLYHKKIFKAYYGFRVPYVFVFPSAGHWPIGSGRDILLDGLSIHVLIYKVALILSLNSYYIFIR